MSLIAFFDLEINPKSKKILDIGAVRSDEATFHKNHPAEFQDFIVKADYLCGHNVLAHDLVYLQRHFGKPSFGLDKVIDTLLFSPLLFPKNPYHKLLKDDKLQTEELNNPLNDSQKARNLFFDEVNAFHELSEELKTILASLLNPQIGFSCFFKYVAYTNFLNAELLGRRISQLFQNKICKHCDLGHFIQENPVALAYTDTGVP